MSYSCILCKKNYKSYQSIWNHNNKFHPNINITIPVIDNKIRKFNCINCNKKFTRKDNMIFHQENNCKNKSNIDPKILQKELIELRKEVNDLKTNKSNTTINIDKTANINNGNINNGTINIIINKPGTENLLELNDKEIKDIFGNKLEGVITFVKLLNFNERLPSNHSFCSTSLEGPYLSIYNTDNSIVDKDRKKYFFEDLLSRSVNKMEELYKKYKNKFKEDKQQQIEADINTLKYIKDKDMNDSLLKEMLKKLNLLSYNYRQIILNTWENYKTSGKKIKTFEEELEDNENYDIKEIENLFIKVDNNEDNNYKDNSSDIEDSDTPDKPKLILNKKIKEIEV